MTDEEKTIHAVSSLAGFIRNEKKRIRKMPDLISRDDLEELWEKLEKAAEDVMRFSAAAERKRELTARLEAAEKEAAARERARAEQLRKTGSPTYNLRCQYHVQELDRRSGEVIGHRCDVDYPMDHCGTACPYATNMPGRTRDSKRY